MVSKEEIIKIAKLSNLWIDEEEIEPVREEMAKIIEFAHTINDVVEDGSVEFDNINEIVNAFNEDVVVDSYDREEVLKNREGGENGYFLVRRRA
ncbi:MAG TPA: aspartyl/glutamyl-tRNA amidotransferase subunit C [Tissierellia bacterium]|jgi:aspartyl-tRNA(Asn)/glutamyl-tRNA(Gln) amidotransferase subunit C|nr:aspartyl/glutamyl-tRNA amidotransferase subunit C [Tissierellia bacterium]